MRLGPSLAATGDNQIRTETDRSFIVENEPGAHDDLRAEDNFWLIAGTLQDDPADVDVHPYVRTDLADSLGSDAPRVDVDPLLDDNPLPQPCHPTVTLGGGTSALAGRQAGAFDESSREAATDVATARALPERSAMGSPRPNPTRGGASFELAVGRSQGGRYEVAVFDVTGRRTASVLKDVLEPGYYEVQWDGRDGGGLRAATGIYFLRCSGPGLTALRKVVLLE